jgi:ATPase family associated with various cellular activities (AAA)
MRLTDQLTDYINAAFSGIWIQTFEPDEAERDIIQLATRKKWKAAVWDIANGMRLYDNDKVVQADTGAGDPLAAVRALPALAAPKRTALLLLHNFHRFLNSPEVIQTTFSQLVAGKAQRTFVVVLSPATQIPVELEKLFVVLEHQLPDREQLLHIARDLTKDTPDDLPKGTDLERVLDAAAGLTRYEAEGAFSLSLTRHNSLRPECLWELKAQTLAKSGLCSLYRGEPRSFEQLKGVDHVRRLTRQLLRPNCPIPPKGWLFVGPPNCGKTTVAKAIATDNGLPLILGDLPSLKAKHVGESEGRVRQFIALCEAMAPCAVLLDEVEDALAGATADQSGDSGVSRDQLSTILKWRSESRARVFLMATCNEPERLLKVKQGALFRDGRFDGIVFFDLPEREAKDGMWTQYRSANGIPSSEPNPPDDGWAPGNIEVCCQRAVQYQIPLAEAARYVRPTPQDDIERLRTWAEGRCLSASNPGIYSRNGQQPPRATRPVQRDPSNN